MPDVGVSYNAETGEVWLGDLSVVVPVRLLTEAPPNGWGSSSQWDSRATNWLRARWDRDDVFVHVFSISPPRVALLVGNPADPPANWWDK